jgi:predicted Zn-dependent protease
LTPVHEKEPRDVTARLYLRNSHRGRVEAYNRLKKHAEALKEWDRVIELSPKSEQSGLRIMRAISRINTGQVAEGVAEVAELTKTSGWAAGQWYNFACAYAAASGKSEDKKQEYADTAMVMLQKAVKAGWKNASHMKKDSDLEPLREREDFKKLLAELENKKK